MNKPFDFKYNVETADAEILQESPIANGGSIIEVAKQVRGGRGTRAGNDLGPAVQKTQEERVEDERLIKEALERDEKRFDKELKEMTEARSNFVDNIVSIKKRLTGASDEESKHLHTLLSQARDHLHILDSIFPQKVVAVTHTEEVFRNIVRKFKEYEDVRRKQTLADIKLNKGEGSVGEVTRAQAEAHTLHEEIASLARKGELILKHKESPSAQDDSLSLTHKETVEERNFLNRRHSERVAPGVFGLKKENEEMQKEMDKNAIVASEASIQQQGEPVTINETGFEEKNMKQELPPLEFTLGPTEDEKNLSRVEERIKEITARQAELEAEPKGPFQKSEIGEELDELAKEMSSLEQRRNGIEEKKPLQSAYDMAMDRIWKENEEKRNIALGKEAQVISAEITPEPEDDSLLPITTESVMETVGTPIEGQAEAFEKFENIAEEKNVSKERALSMIASMRENVEAEAEKKNVPKRWIRRVGETWNKVPTRYKLLLTVGMFASGLGSAAVGATAAVGTLATIGAGLRAVGGAGLFVAIENGLKNRAEKKGSKRSGIGELRDTTIAAALSIFVIGVLPNMARDYAVEHGFFQKISEFFGFGGAQVEAPVESGEYIQIAKNGDSVWKMAGNIVGEKYPNLSPEQKTYLIDAIKDRIEKYPGSYGLTDANKIIPGQGVDFGGIFGDKEFMDNALSSAKNLAPEQVANIKNVDASVPVETSTGTVSSDEFLNEQLHTTFTPEDATPVVTEQAIPTPEQVVLPAESYVAYPNALLESGNLRGHFSYSPSGRVEGFTVEGGVSTADAHNLLNSNWQEVVRNHQTAGGADMDISTVSLNATNVLMYEKMLEALEKKGERVSVESIFLSNYIGKTVGDIENIYGDVFKNVEDFGKPEKLILSPVEVKDVLMEGVIHEASEQAIPTSFIKPEILPGNTVELAYVMASADAIISKDMDILFGESKFLGFGHTNGIDSINWKDPQVGFGGKTVTEIMNSTPSAVPAEGGKTFGVQNYEATSKMKEYLSSVTHMTGVNPNSNEKVVDFIRRASVAKLSK